MGAREERQWVTVEQGARLLREGRLVAFPTETVYGLGADAFRPEAVARVFAVKKRPRFDPLIVHVASQEEIHRIAYAQDPLVERLVEAFWPGPLTLVLPKKESVPPIVTAGLMSVGVRMPDHPLALKLIALCGNPVAAPSANPFGRVSPTTAEHVLEQLGDRIDGILDGGPCRVGVESTVVSLLDPGNPVILRPGGVTVERIRALIGRVKVSRGPKDSVEAPGMLPLHYAPRTAVRILGDMWRSQVPLGGRVGLLALGPEVPEGPWEAVEILSDKGDLVEAAARLFSALHRLDALGLDLILAESVPREGLGLAIMDRLERASANKG